MNGEIKAMAMDENKPRLCLYDKQIDEYLGEKFDSVDVDDTITLTIKAKITAKSKEETTEYSMLTLATHKDDDEETRKKKEPKKKIHRRLELEIVGASKDSPPKDDSAPTFKRYDPRM